MPRELTLGPTSRADTTRAGRDTILTFEGLSRLVRHIIPQFISRQESVPKEPYDYSREEPGMIQVELASKYWIHQPGDCSAKAGKKRLFAFCGQMATAMRTRDTLEITDISVMLALVGTRLEDMTRHDRLPFIALYCLFNLVVPADDRIDDNSDIVRRYWDDLALPSIEAMLLALFTRSVLQWDLDDHERALRTYFGGQGQIPRNQDGWSARSRPDLGARGALPRGWGNRQSEESHTLRCGECPWEPIADAS